MPEEDERYLSMHSFLRKLARVTTVQEVLLLSFDGVVLYRSLAGAELPGGEENPAWAAVLDNLEGAAAAEFCFADGRYCLRRIPLGVIAVGLRGDTALVAIRQAFDSVAEKLADAAMCRKVLQAMLPQMDEGGRSYLSALLVHQGEAERAVAPAAQAAAGGGDDEAEIQAALAGGDKQLAIELIMEKIGRYARGHRFEEAERLREHLLEIDPMALLAGIRAAELIEEEKTASIGLDVQSIWKDLLRSLSREEFAALYHAAPERSYVDGEVVVRHGEFNASLFLVNGGQVQMVAESDGRQVLLWTYGPGEIVGAENFFDASVWTVDVVSRGAQVSVLRRGRLIALKESQPALYGKLQDYCARFPTTGALFQKNRRSRRVHERRRAQGRVVIDLLDNQGSDTGLTAKGELLDLSRGGVALTLRFSKKKSAAALLGKMIRIHLRPKSAVDPLQRTGTVMAVRCHDFVGNEYSLHVRFETELPGNDVTQLTSAAR